jgi:pimeloyl-ACP methyl ester carboxylesterase
MTAKLLDESVDVDGPDGAPAIIFLHGVSYTRKVWLPQMRALSDDYRVAAMDFPGHGTRANEPFDFEEAVQSVGGVINALDAGPVLLVGASLGGCVAMEASRRFRWGVAGLVISGASFDASTPLCRLVLLGESIVFPRIVDFMTRRFERKMRNRLDAPTAETVIAAGCYWKSAGPAVRQLAGRDLIVAMSTFDGPTLILNGRRDFVHRFYERRFSHKGRHAEIQIIPGANHTVSVDRPAEFTAAVRRFAETKVWPPTAVR